MYGCAKIKGKIGRRPLPIIVYALVVQSAGGIRRNVFSIMKMEPKTELEQAVADLLVTTLNLDARAEDIDPLAPLYGDAGLGLDSIDMLELSLGVSRQYGFQLRSDAADNVQIFASLRALSQHIDQHRVR